MPQDPKAALVAAILAGDRRSASALVNRWAEAHGYHSALVEVLEPALDEFGKTWAVSEHASLAQGYVAGKVAQDYLDSMAARIEDLVEFSSNKRGAVVIGNIEEDAHALGRGLVGVFLRIAGWNVYDLGTDVAAAEFVDRALEAGAHVVGASAMMYTTAMNIRLLRKEIDSRGLRGKLQLAVGGAVFVQRPELVAEVGGDGTARNALEAPTLVARLQERALAARVGE